MNKYIERLQTKNKTMQGRASQYMANGRQKNELKRHLIDVGHVVIVLILSTVFFTGLAYLFSNGLLMIGIPIVTAAYAVIAKGAPL